MVFLPPKFETGFNLERSRVLVLDDLGQLAVLVGLEGDDRLVGLDLAQDVAGVHLSIVVD